MFSTCRSIDCFINVIDVIDMMLIKTQILNKNRNVKTKHGMKMKIKKWTGGSNENGEASNKKQIQNRKWKIAILIFTFPI
jgi:hypothetical protein